MHLNLCVLKVCLHCIKQIRINGSYDKEIIMKNVPFLTLTSWEISFAISVKREHPVIFRVCYFRFKRNLHSFFVFYDVFPGMFLCCFKCDAFGKAALNFVGECVELL